MELVKLTEDQISSLLVSDADRKSNEAFAKLSAIIKYYNDGWKPTSEDRGYMVYSKKQLILYGGVTYVGAYSGFSSLISAISFVNSIADIGSRLVIRDYELCKFIAENYEQLYKDLWKEND